MSDTKIISKSNGTHDVDYYENDPLQKIIDKAEFRKQEQKEDKVSITMERFTLWGRFKDNRAPAQWSEKSADGFYKLYDRYDSRNKWGVERDIPAVIEDWKSDGLIEWKIYRLKQTVTEEIYKIGSIYE